MQPKPPSLVSLAAQARGPKAASAPEVEAVRAPEVPDAGLSAVVAPPPTEGPPAARAEAGLHPHAALDRTIQASLAQLTGGLSPHAMLDA